MVKSPRIERGDWLTLQVKVTEAWDDGRITVEHQTGQKVTMGGDSAEIIEITKPHRSRQSSRRRRRDASQSFLSPQVMRKAEEEDGDLAWASTVLLP
jgi:hypothetical protein